MSKGNPPINSTIVNPTSSIRELSIDQRIDRVEKNLAPLKSIEMAGQGERVLQGRNTVIPGGAPAPAPAPTPAPEPSNGVPEGYVETAVTLCQNGSPVGGSILFKPDTP